MKLYGRKWRLVVHTIEIVGLRVTFTVDRSLATPPNQTEIKIYNLSEDHRRELAKFRWVPVLLEAGYEGSTGAIFLGRLRTAYPERPEAGSPDTITTLLASDGENEMRRARVRYTVRPGTPNEEVLRVVAKAIGVGDGNLDTAISKLKVSGVGKRFQTGTVLYGNAAREMTSICQSLELSWSIQDGKLQILPLRQSLEGEAILCSVETGMIGSPTIDQQRMLNAKMLIQPDIIPGRKIVVQSEFWSGQFRLNATTFVGDTHGQEWYVELKGQRY